MPKGAVPATVLAMVLVGYGGAHLALALIPVTHPPLPGLTTGQGAAPDKALAAPQPWPAVFGTPPDAPAPAPVVAVSTRYGLKGLIARESGGWAVLTEGNGEVLVRVGDVLADGTEVVGIDRHGVTLDQNGTLTLVGFSEAAATDDGGAGPPAEPAPDRAEIASIRTTRTQLDLTGLDQNGLRRILARAGALEQIELAGGGKALDLLWIRNGQLFDKLGLQAGDRILQINGIDVGDDQAILRAAGQLLGSDSYRIDLLRNGERLAIEVEVVKNG